MRGLVHSTQQTEPSLLDEFVAEIVFSVVILSLATILPLAMIVLNTYSER